MNDNTKCRFHWKALRTVAVSVAVLTGLAACGSSSGSSERSGTDTASTAANAKVTTVGLGLLNFNSLHIDYIVAMDENTMAPLGIKLQPILLSSQANVLPAVISGSAQFGSSTPEAVFAARAKGASLKLVSNELSINPTQIIGQSNMSSLSDLKGKTFGVAAIGVSEDYVTAAVMLEEAGVKVNFTNDGSPAGSVAAMLAGSIQGTAPFPPTSNQLVAKGYKILATASDDQSFHGIYLGGLTSNPSWYSSHRTLAVNFMKGIQAADNFMYDPANKAKVIADISKTQKTTTAEATATYNYFVGGNLFYKVPTPTLQALTKQITNDTKAGVKGLPSPSSPELAQALDSSLIEAAQ